MSKRIIRLELERFLQQRDRRRRAFRHQFVDERQRLQHQVIGIQAVRPFAFDALDLDFSQARLDCADHAHCDLVLHGKDVAQQSVIALGPDLHAAVCFDQLGGNADAVAGFAHAALEHVVDAKILPQSSYVDCFALVDEARIARDDE